MDSLFYYKDFIEYLTHQKRYSGLTVKSYQTDLTQFARFLADVYDVQHPKEATHTIIRSWIVQLMEGEMSPNSVNRKISTLKSYYKFLVKEGVVDKNPMLKIIAPKKKKKLPVFVSNSSMDTLLDQMEFPTGFKGVRDKLVLSLFYYTGIRKTELTNLLETDVDLYQCTIKVTGKRNKQRIIPFGNELSELFKSYIKNKNEEGLKNEFLIVTDKGDKCYEKFVYNLVNNYLSMVTTVEKKSPHVLRHTFATHMLNNGADLTSIKDLLGHANFSATEVYTHNTFEKLKNIHKQAHPRA